MTETTEPTETPGEQSKVPRPDQLADPLAAQDPIGDHEPAPEHEASEHEASEHGAPEHGASKTRRDPLPVLFGIGVVVLIGAVVFLWRHPLNLSSFSSQPASSTASSAPPAPSQSAASSPVPSSPATTDQAAAPPPPPPSDTAAATPPAPTPAPPPAPSAPASPAPAPADQTAAAAAPMPLSPGGPTAEQFASLEQRLDKLQQQIDQLAHQPSPDLSPLEKRVAALENRPAPPPPPNLAPAIAALTSRIEEISGQLAQVAAKETSDQSATDAKIGVIGRQAAELASLSDRAAKLGRLQAATAALAAGQPLGPLPDAPPALAKFSTSPPPTEASLRLAFPAAAEAAQDAAQPQSGKQPFWQAVQNRAESLVTVRRGDEVLVGDPTAGVIARARTALEAGDLAGAVAAVSSLTGAPAQAMAQWTSQAKALLDARAALAAMAARA